MVLAHSDCIRPRVTLPGGIPDIDTQGFRKVDLKSSLDSMDAVDITLWENYPEKGWVKNTACDMVVFIKAGEVELEFYNRSGNQTRKELCPAGSTTFVPKDQPYRWITKGKVVMLIVSNPPWSIEQQEVVE